MGYGRHLAFWVVTFVVLAAALWLLHDILLPFVAGIALAYVLAPVADRAERFGINRTVAALLIVGIFVVSLISLILLLVPLLIYTASTFPALFNLGIRHYLPAYPFWFLLVGWLWSAERGCAAERCRTTRAKYESWRIALRSTITMWRRTAGRAGRGRCGC